MLDPVTETVRGVRAQSLPALPSVCSAHPDVIEASMRLCHDLDRQLLLEATSNQVNQFGGYTGMTPGDFRAFVHTIADGVGFARDRLVFGGDHLGPQAWKSDPAEAAMDKAEALVSAYVAAGFTKIHLDCSEGCAGEPGQVGDDVSAERAARLAAACEAASDGDDEITYIVGTEVPPPGGARGHETIVATTPDAARNTIACHRRAFQAKGLDAAWSRVRGLVVQPGLEFGPTSIDRLDITAPDALSQALDGHPNLAFEAHSTDYQKDEVYPDLARRNFAFLKVGPALTFAWREALYALSHCNIWINAGGPHISDVMERLMQRDSSNWTGHYQQDAPDAHVLRHFGYADRIRYYWTEPEARAAVSGLLDALESQHLPEPLVRQYLPAETLARADAITGVSRPRAILMAHVQTALCPYYGKKSC